MNSHRSSDKHGNITVTLLIIFGLIILGSAGFLLLSKKKAPPKIVTTTEVQREKEAFLAPEPITVDHRPRNIPASDSDDSNQAQTETASTKKIMRPRLPKSSTTENNDPVSSGTIDTKELSLFINSKFYSVKSCYERRLKVNPMMEGVVDLRITVLPSGKVAGVYVNSDSVGDALMLECVKTTVKKWQFPKPTGGKIIFDKPFNFKKKS
ncbi:MAG: TonB family protein [Deltaproteobacteria bacterium]|nr:TonB family protein [Deltaproteobacteria bacterium]